MDDQKVTKHPRLNGAILVELKIIHVVSSASETGGIFHNAQVAISIRILLQPLGNIQPHTSLKTDNSTSIGFVHDSIHRKQSK